MILSPMLSVFLLFVTINGVLSTPANAPARNNREQPAMITTTAELPASGVLEDPMLSTTPSESMDDSSWEKICVRCYDQVQIARDAIQIHNNILMKQKKLLNRKGVATGVVIPLAPEATSTRKPRLNNRTTNARTSNSQNSTVRQRTLDDQSDMKVISRLRVARSSADDQAQQQRPSNEDKHWLNKKDGELERLKREQQRQKDIACKTLSDLHQCLEQYSRECIANLHFHTYELFYDQFHGRLRCPFSNNPNAKPFPNTLFFRLFQEDEVPKVGQPRRISSNTEVRARLHEILPTRSLPKPPGVQLTPYQMRSTEQTKESYRYFTPMQRKSGDDRWAVGRLLLVPACFALLVALLVVIHHKRPWRHAKSISDGH